MWAGDGWFNDWVRGSYLAEANNRQVVDVAHHIMTGAAFLYRIQSMKIQGMQIPDYYCQYHPVRY